MKKTGYFLYFLFLSILLISCSAIQQGSSKPEEWVKPGGQIGKMTLEQGLPTLPYPDLWAFCEFLPDTFEPLTSSTDCEVPSLSGMTIQFGWLAKESELAANWEAMTWALTLDGYQIDLKAFVWEEADFVAHEQNNKQRSWLLDLRNLSPGKHTLQFTQTIKTEINDGFNIYQPGTYEYAVHFTVLEKVKYPQLSSSANPGQHPYTSKKAGVDFLLYLPDDYGKDPQEKWPLIVYLHGAYLRGATLELLRHEPLPKKIESEPNFPFIVLSPLGDGEFEFWAKEAMIDPLFTLLEEIQATYSVNAKQIYLTGNDMGGNGVWAIGLRRPEYFAALAPLAGYYGYPFEVPENICNLKDVPVWAFHGKRDEFVPVEVDQNLVAALVACGGNAQITVSPDMKNDIHYKVYDNPELYTWFLSQSLK